MNNSEKEYIVDQRIILNTIEKYVPCFSPIVSHRLGDGINRAA
jgi:hypothetical protein